MATDKKATTGSWLNSGGMSIYYGLGLYDNWDNMSALQKALYMSRLGLSSYKFTSGKDFGDTQIPGTDKYGNGLNINQGLYLMGSGMDLANGVQNWDTMNATGRIIFGGNSLKNTIQSYDIVNQYINGAKAGNALSNSAEFAGLSGGLSAYNLFNTATNWNRMGTEQRVASGINSINSGANIAKLSSRFVWNKASEKAGETVAEQGTTAAGETLTGDAAADMLGQYVVPGTQVAAGAYGMYQGAKIASDNWGKGGVEGRQAGLAAGAAAGLGAVMTGAGLATLTGLAALGPAGWIAGAVLLTGAMLGTTIKTGKSTDQTQRDSIRDVWKDNYSLAEEGADGKYRITLTNGKQADVGIDGHGKYEGQKDKMQAFDVDLDSTLDFFAGTGGIALNRILMGGDGQGHMAAIDQTGAQIGNAILSGTVGFGKEFTKENFEIVKKELLGQFSKAGIGTKDEYYAVVNELAAQKRITEEQQIAMHQIANMMYDKDGYEGAQKIYNHRQQAVDAVKAQAADAASSVKSNQTTTTPQAKDNKVNDLVYRVPKDKEGTYKEIVDQLSSTLRTKDEVKAANRAKFARGK